MAKIAAHRGIPVTLSATIDKMSMFSELRWPVSIAAEHHSSHRSGKKYFQKERLRCSLPDFSTYFGALME
jgi:hypothetical protein